MFVFFIIVLLLSLHAFRIAPEETIDKGYLSRETTTAIKGIFISLVFLSHVSTYVHMESASDTIYYAVKSYLGQFVVAYFLFASGFGIMESIKRKGQPYIKRLPTKRIGKTLLHFDMAVLLFLLLDLAIGTKLSIQQIGLSLIAFTNIGNSDWYIFAILGTYICTWIGFSLVGKKSNLAGMLLSSALIALFVLWQYFIGRPDYAFNTIICYPLGMTWSLIKPKFDTFIQKNNTEIKYWILLTLCFIVYAMLDGHKNSRILWYQFSVVFFVILILLLSLKLNFNNAFTQFMGTHLFSIYILQRIPMNLLAHFSVNIAAPHVYVIICFLSTIVFALLFDKISNHIDSWIFS